MVVNAQSSGTVTSMRFASARAAIWKYSSVILSRLNGISLVCVKLTERERDCQKLKDTGCIIGVVQIINARITIQHICSFRDKLIVVLSA